MSALKEIKKELEARRLEYHELKERANRIGLDDETTVKKLADTMASMLTVLAEVNQLKILIKRLEGVGE